MILGIDEVGRGPLAGPLVIGAVILEDATADWCAELTDSKKLSAAKRTRLSAIILDKAPATALGWVSSREIDERGLGPSLRLATRRAVNQILAQHVKFDEIIIDGTINFLADTPLVDYVTTLKKADLLIKEVSAASIIAKVARDEYMVNLAEQYPEYGFDKHVGYGTAAHRAAIAAHGPCPEHRRSFKLKKENQITTKKIGDKAESVVADYLKSQGHRILFRNHKTKFYEIDIISATATDLYFTEVKYRSAQSHGTSLDQITSTKQHQMKFAAEAFLKYQPYLKTLNPHLAAAAVSGPDYHLDDWFTLD